MLRTLAAAVRLVPVCAAAISIACATRASQAPAPSSTVPPSATSPPAKPDEPKLRLGLLDNGAFAEPNADAIDFAGARRIPWWRSKPGHGMEQVVELDVAGRPRAGAPTPSATDFAARTGGAGADAEFLEQPVPVYAPLARSLVIAGSVLGRGRVIVRDGNGAVATFAVGNPEAWTPFSITGDELARKIGGEPMPRFVLRLESADETGAPAYWRRIGASAELPCPSPADLRAEIDALVAWGFHECLTRGIDSVGPRKTGFFTHDFDAVTGERIVTFPAVALNPLFDYLRTALEVREDPEWRAGFDAYVEDLLALGMHPVTGLPRLWDCRTDEPRDDVPVEIGLTLGFLNDVIERGPDRWRERAKAAAVKMATTVLRSGVVPDGSLAASYVPSNGAVNLNVARLRRLDVLAQLARLAALTGEKRFLAVARDALAAFEYTHLWSGTWQQIDPAFDDEYGHYGARAATSWRAVPNEKLFKELALGGWKHFEPLWKDSVRLGGTCAADQVRCWVLLADVAAMAPEEADAIRTTTWAALRAHFKGEQGSHGAWGDLTVVDFDPQDTMARAVGDFPGAPHNLLQGIAALYDRSSSNADELRAMFTAVMRSSVQAYKRPHGFLIDNETKGANSAMGSLRLLFGLTKMYRRLK